MPLGWYLAQGLIPLGPSSSDDEEGPCELPNGKLVCGPHGLVVCPRCCSDYSFMADDSEDDDEDEDEDLDEDLDEEDASPVIIDAVVRPSHHGPSKGTGRVFPTKFVPPSDTVTPSELFTGHEQRMLITRYTLRNDHGKAIIRTDGACLENGQRNPKAGWGFWHGFGPSGSLQLASGRLENKGPFGDDALQTSNRAELRAVIAALRFRNWAGEGFHTLVIATDSEYVVEGATNWTRAWIRRGWVKSDGAAVKNRDLWEALLGEIEKFSGRGMAVEFWRIPRLWNTVADEAAKVAACDEDVPEWWDVFGMNFM